jgi:hypothetical protein
MIKAVTIKEIEASPILMPTHSKIHQFKDFYPNMNYFCVVTNLLHF